MADTFWEAASNCQFRSTSSMFWNLRGFMKNERCEGTGRPYGLFGVGTFTTSTVSPYTDTGISFMSACEQIVW